MTTFLVNQPRRLEATTWGMGTECPMNNRLSAVAIQAQQSRRRAQMRACDHSASGGLRTCNT